MTQEELLNVLEATWPPAMAQKNGIWSLRDGQGGGKRVSATRASGGPTAAEVRRFLSEHPDEHLFQLTPDQSEADETLETEGFSCLDPTEIYYVPMDDLSLSDLPPVTAFPIWPSLAIMNEIWAEDGIGPARRAVMDRAASPKTAFLGRIGNRAAGAAFVSMYNGTAMLHGLAVREAFRRQGLGRYLAVAAALWARDQSATSFALAVTEANAAARALYQSLGMTIAGRYHYRMKSTSKGLC